MPLAGPQAQGPLPVALGNSLQALLGGADDGGQNHDHQRQAAGQDARLQSHKLDKNHHAHQAEDDGRDPGEGFGGKFDDSGQTPVGGILRQIDGSAHPQWQDDSHGQHNDVDGAGDVGQDAGGSLEHTGLGGQQLPGD